MSFPFSSQKGFLAEAIESILSQSGDISWELLLINDGSTVSDRKVARHYVQRYPERIFLHEHKGRRRHGISASRNLGICQARGELIAFLDADDTWFTHKLVSQVTLLSHHPEAAMIYGPGLRWSSWKGGVDISVPALVDGFGTDCLAPGSALLNTFIRDETLTPCIGSVIIRRAALEIVGGFEEQFEGLYDDQVLYAKLCRTEKIYVSSDCVSRYRQHKESCCGRARVEGLGEQALERFLAWLDRYQAETPVELPELAGSSSR